MLAILSFIVTVLLTGAALAWLLLSVAPAYRLRPGREFDLVFIHETTYAWHARTERLVQYPVVGEEFEAVISLSPGEAQNGDREVALSLTETTQLADVTVGVVATGCEVSRVGQTHNSLSFGEEIHARFAITPRQPGRTELRFELRDGDRLLAVVVDPVDVRTRVAGVVLPRRVAIAIGVVVAIIGWLNLVAIAWRAAREVLVGWWARV